MTESVQELDILIRARYPLIFVNTYEETRLEQTVRRMAGERNKAFFLWTATLGLRKDGESGAESTKEPLTALNAVERQTLPALFLFKDFHPYLSDPTVVRKLRDLVENLKNTYETILFVSPVLTVPPELEKDVAVVDFALPADDEIGALLDHIVKTVEGRGRVQVSLTAEVREKLINAARGLTLNEAANAFARAIVVDAALGEGDVRRVLEEKRQVIRKSGILEYFATDESMAHVGGMDCLKEWLATRAAGFTAKAKEFGLPEPKGILLVGVQGCGKSLTAKAVSNLWQMPLLRFDVARVFSGVVGSSEENIRRAIRTAESVAPVVLWIDEIEKALSGVQSSTFSDAGTSARVFGTITTWLQEKTKPVFVVATANNISLLPPELLRKGRFDEIFFIDLPDRRERQEIFAIHLRKRGRDPAAFDLAALADAAVDFSGAEIEQAVISGLFAAFVAHREVTAEDILASIRESVPLSRTMSEEIEQLRAWAKTRTRPASRPAPQEAEGGRKLEVG